MKQNSASIAKRKFQKAQRCAHIVEKKQGGKAKWVVIILVVIFAFIMIVGGQDDSSSSGKNTQSSAESEETVSNNSNAKAESEDETEGGTITAGQSFEASYFVRSGGLIMNYKEEIIEMIEKCDDIHWIKAIYAYVKRLLG
jgi:hypothetical protein